MLTELEKKNFNRIIDELRFIIDDIKLIYLTPDSLMKTTKLIAERNWELTLLAGKLSSRESKQ